jgi:hypothetical protein
MHQSPWIKPTLSNGLDANPKVVEHRNMKVETDRWGPGSTDLRVGSADPLYARWTPLRVVVFSCLLESSLLRVGSEFDFYPASFISFLLFLITPYRNIDSPKLWNSVSINPNSMLEVDLCPFSCLVDGLK